MHAIVMVHKMQSMTLSNHQLIPAKAESASGDAGAAGDSLHGACGPGDHIPQAPWLLS